MAKRGGGVDKAELGPAEEDPRFNIGRDQFAVSQIKDTPPIFVREVSK